MDEDVDRCWNVCQEKAEGEQDMELWSLDDSRTLGVLIIVLVIPHEMAAQVKSHKENDHSMDQHGNNDIYKEQWDSR